MILFQAMAPLSSGQYLLMFQQCYRCRTKRRAPMFLLACLHRVRQHTGASMVVEISRYNNLLRHSHQQKFTVQNSRLLKEYKIIPRRIFLLLSLPKRELLQNNLPFVFCKIVNRLSDCFREIDRFSKLLRFI